MSDYYDPQGRPIPMREWAVMFENFAERRIAHTVLPGGCMVSTVWLGLDHSFGTGPPLIFESMVFESEENMAELDCMRYSTRAEAEDGHSLLVTRWTGWTPGDPTPEDTRLSPLGELIEALEVAAGERPVSAEASAENDQMVVMYPKEIADRMEET